MKLVKYLVKKQNLKISGGKYLFPLFIGVFFVDIF